MADGRRPPLDGREFDVAIVGAGINGACLYDRCRRAGYRTLLVDRGDFASGTSMSSAMMVWGGLLYLTSFDWAAVRSFCRGRDAMIRDLPGWVRACPNRLVIRPGNTLPAAVIMASQYLYWLLGNCRRARPRRESGFPERGMLADAGRAAAIRYEEAVVSPSDARFVARWILAHPDGDSLARNHCALTGGGWDAAAKAWRLEVRDESDGGESAVRAACVVNAAGIWTDALNDGFGIATAWKHVLSKGVFLGLPRDARHEVPLMFETGDPEGWMTHEPWGPVALWGPTESAERDPEAGRRPTAEDVRVLLGRAAACLAPAPAAAEIVSLRCGVRPLAVPRSHDPRTPTLSISRRAVVAPDRDRPWISLYGGKLTGCEAVAAKTVHAVASRVGPPRGTPSAPAEDPAARPPMESYPGLAEPVVGAAYARDAEACRTLDDYLRRRTNIAQWVPRGGLGRADEHLPRIRELAAVFHGPGSDAAVEAYRRRIAEGFDAVLAAV